MKLMDWEISRYFSKVYCVDQLLTKELIVRWEHFPHLIQPTMDKGISFDFVTQKPVHEQ